MRKHHYAHETLHAQHSRDASDQSHNTVGIAQAIYPVTIQSEPSMRRRTVEIVLTSFSRQLSRPAQ